MKKATAACCLLLFVSLLCAQAAREIKTGALLCLQGAEPGTDRSPSGSLLAISLQPWVTQGCTVHESRSVICVSH